MGALLTTYLPVIAGTRPILIRWLHLGGNGGSLGRDLTGERACNDGVGRYAHYERGSIYWHPETGVREFFRVSVRYGTEVSELSMDEMRGFVQDLSLSAAHMKKPGTWDKILSSDPIGQDPGEKPNWAGREGWGIVEKFIERLKQRYEERYENQPPGPELPPVDPLPEPPEGRERGDSFRDMDRGNYEAERFDRISRTA